MEEGLALWYLNFLDNLTSKNLIPVGNKYKISTRYYDLDNTINRIQSDKKRGNEHHL